jgi:carbon storage regulator CsrA
MPMLVISSKPGEKFVLPHSSMSVTVIGVEGSTVRLEISVPPEVTVHRLELGSEIHAEDANLGEAPPTNSTDALVAKLSDIAYQISLRHGPADSWVNLELHLWKALGTAMENWPETIMPPLQKPSSTKTQPAKVTRASGDGMFG